MKKFLLLFLIFDLLAFPGIAQQADVSMTLQKPPGLSLSVAESINLTIINNEDTGIECYLTGTIEESAEGQIAEGQSNLFTVETGINSLNSTNVELLQPSNIVFSQQDYKDYIERTNKFPPGDYTICISLIRNSDVMVLAEDCFSKSVDDFIPPSLISPEDGATLNKANPFFTWSPSTSAGGGSPTYEIRIVEILDDQSPLAAFEANPLWFSEAEISNPIFQYPLSAEEFDKNTDYAWKVVGYTGGQKIGESEVWTFSYKISDTTEKEEEEPDLSMPDKHYELKREFANGYYLLDEFTINFSYRNNYTKHKLNCAIIDAEGNTVGQDVFQKEQKHGLNLNEVDVSSHAEKGKLYTLKCSNKLEEVRGFKFKVRKEEESSGLNDINLEKLNNQEMDQIINNL